MTTAGPGGYRVTGQCSKALAADSHFNFLVTGPRPSCKSNSVPMIPYVISRSQDIRRRSEMEYSADDIAAAEIMQYLALSYASDILASPKWKFLLQSRWSMVKALYIIARYVPFVLITVDVYLNFTPNENPNKCRIMIIVYSGFFVLRTYALWNSNRTVLVGSLSTVLAIVVTSITLRFTTVVTSPGITGCYWTSRSVQYFMSFVLLFVFQLGLVSLTLIRVIQSWRSAKSKLHAVLVKHYIFYYACGLFFSALNVIMPVIFSVHILYHTRRVFILANLATRMHLDLWHIDRE
ncbi:hypothetical protein DEU56DRAFT_759839, partial [Suillus clintonianus]|uniref:uncharacterized protein n=1 Tax=Suillus clintonianus TaxID=1904413 RepID=UPI001B862E1A